MTIKTFCKKVIKKTKKIIFGIEPEPPKPPAPEPPPVIEIIYRILLLTNRDSDNVGDQVIEATDIALIKAVMKNLQVPEGAYAISSRAASIVSQKYLATKNPEYLKGAEKAIQANDLVVFGGAPIFNYLYQNFYERTAVTVELAQQYGKPVIFSAIGVESYDEENQKCQRLKATLNLDCVRQITTRDDYDKLLKYRDREDLLISRVSDPAVFSSKVFEKFATIKKVPENPEPENNKPGTLSTENNEPENLKPESTPPAIKEPEKKKIGIFILRSNGFTDNKVDFPRDAAARLWVSLAGEAEKRGYSYEFLTSGHFGDEAFLDYLIRTHGIEEKKCVFNINCPEDLTQKISSYDAVVSCRLHPSIISFSFDVPSLGIVWNSKVPGFYNSIGYPERTITVDGISAEKIMDKLEQIMEEGVKKDTDYLLTVYTSLFHGIKNALAIEGDEEIAPYNFEELMQNLPAYTGTPQKEKKEKLKRKFRRAYDKYNSLFEKNLELKEKNSELKEKVRELEALNKNEAEQ